MSKLKVFWATIAVFGVLATFSTCQHDKIRKEKEMEGYIPRIESMEYEDVVDPVETFEVTEDLAPKKK